MGIGDLGHVLADFDLGDDGAVFVLDGGELVDAAEDGLALGGDEPLAHAKGVDPGALEEQIPDDILVQGVGGHDLTVGEAGGVQHLPGLAGEVGQIAAVQPDVVPVSSEEYPSKAKRPHNSRLDTSKLEEAGFTNMPSWQDALHRFIAELNA